MSKLIIASLKASTNGKSVMVNFQESSTRTTTLDSNLSDYQRASGMVAQTYTDDIVRYCTERLSPEAASALEEGQEVSGFHIQTYKGASPFYVVDGKPQGATKSGMFFAGVLVLAELGEDVPVDVVVSMASHPELYRVVNAGVTVRGAAAVDQMVAGGLASLTKATNIVEGATV